MNAEISLKLDDFLEKLETHAITQEYQEKKQSILNQKDLLEMIAQLQSLSKEDPTYLPLKQKLYQNQTYKQYIQLEHEITFWTYEITDRLKKLIRSSK